MKIVSLLSMIAAVGVLGVSVFVLTNQNNKVNLGIKASTNMTIDGLLTSPDPIGCKTNFYLGCYKLETSGVNYDLVEESDAGDLSQFVNKSVRVVGKKADLKGKNVLMVSLVNVIEN